MPECPGCKIEQVTRSWNACPRQGERVLRRIVISHKNGAWSFDRQGAEPVTADSPLRAAIAAMAYGETLRGTALGYIIRLDHPGAASPEGMITLHTEVF